MAVLPYFYCPKCDKDINIGDCPHNRQDFTPPIWIREFALWKKDKLKVEGEKLRKFEWLRDNANVALTNPGFESGNYTGWTTAAGNGGTLSVVSSPDPVNEGTYSSKLAATQTTSYGRVSQGFSNKTRIYVRYYFRIDTLLSGAWVNVSGIVIINSTSGGGNTVRWDYWTDGSGVGGWRKNRWYPAFNQSGVDTAYAPAVNTWHALEGTMLIDASVGEYKFWQDGNELTAITETGLDTSGATNLNGIWVQVFSAVHSSATWNCWIDSVVVDDASYIGPIAAGWTHKILGIANASISKVNGVAKANIAKVNGV